MAWDDNPRRNRFGKLRARKPRRPRNNRNVKGRYGTTYAQHAAQGRQRRRGGNGKVYYGARGQAGLARQRAARRRREAAAAAAARGKGPSVGTGRSRSSGVSSSYSTKKAPTPKPKAPTPPKPKPKPKPYRNPVYSNPLEHYMVSATLGSDVAFDGISIYQDPGYDTDIWRSDDSEYNDAFDNSNSLQLGIGSDVTSLTQFTEKYVETTPVYDAAINLPNTGNYVGIQVRIVEV